MKKKTTIYDIAKELNVTVSTVSRALNGFSTISDATKKAVLETAKKMNYSPNKLASSLKSGKTQTIGVIVPSTQVHFFASVIHSIEQTLKNNGYRVLLYQSNESLENEINGVKTLLEAQVDGIIASMSLETEDVSHFKSVIKQNKPLILFDRTHKDIEAPSVTINDFDAGYMATQHLVDKGYRNIGFVTTSHQIKIFNDRYEGFKQALKDNNLSIAEENIVFGGLSIKDGRFGAGKLLRSTNLPDAIIAGDDFTALGVIKKLKENNLVPPHIGVMGFANETFSAFITPSLSTIDQQANKMGAECAKMFLKMVKKKNPYDNIEHIILEPVLVERQSTDKN
ncbi:LacI family DNA-binding transcriptional regulator [Pseudopedobacter beijingensis]|uniref:LacI family DNA-binding transcriptional regulator n=1 Tax=Pseudopedobacter beijingensis TaxID=1207056 RepID=A0ABW4IB62_9SPHI